MLLGELGCENVRVRCGDGKLGWPEMAPFDAIVLSCAAPALPERLWEQVAEGGCLLLPLGPPLGIQHLVLFSKTPRGPSRQELLAVTFVPLR